MVAIFFAFRFAGLKKVRKFILVCLLGNLTGFRRFTDHRPSRRPLVPSGPAMISCFVFWKCKILYCVSGIGKIVCFWVLCLLLGGGGVVSNEGAITCFKLNMSKWLVTAGPYPHRHFEGDGCGLRFDYRGISFLTICLFLCFRPEIWCSVWTAPGCLQISCICVLILGNVINTCEMTIGELFNIGFCMARRRLGHVGRLEGLDPKHGTPLDRERSSHPSCKVSSLD